MTDLRRGALALAVAIAIVAGAGCEPRPREASRPNLVLIVIDTLRPDRLPFHGHDRDTAPFLTSLAERSLVFTRAHSTSSWTAPAMASLFTSLHPFQHGMHVASLAPDRASFEVKVLPEGAPSLAESLRDVGYSTFGVVDNQNVSETPGFDRGFDRFASTHYESAPRVNATLSAWRDDIVASEPYFLYVHYMDPHIPYNEREPWYSENAAGIDPDDDFEESLARYDSEIRFVDEHVGELFRRFGWGDDTVVVITSDHGEEFGEHGGEQHGKTLYREVVDVPLLLYAPARWPNGGRIDARASLVDVAPTLLRLAGHPGEKTHVGASLLPDDGATDADRAVFTQLIWDDRSGKGSPARRETRGVVRSRFKLLDHTGAPDELFDLGADRGETRNVIDAHPEVAVRLAEELGDRVEEAPRYEPGVARIPLDPKQVKKLKALGYAE